MADTMRREAWLRAELEYEHETLERLEGLADPDHVDQAQRFATIERIGSLEGELLELGGPTTLLMRLSGGRIEGHNAPIDAVRTFYDQVAKLADDYETEVLVAPPSPGSHVLKFVTPAQLELDLDTPTSEQGFLELADAVLGFSPDITRDNDGSATVRRAADLSPDAVRAVRRMLQALVAARANLEMTLTADSVRRRATISAEAASFLDLHLSMIDRNIDTETITGRLEGWTKGSGTFELDVAGEIIRGRVPKAVRSQGLGLTIGSQVRATIDIITTERPGMPNVVSRRLKSIEAAGS